jgi:hypothetical protein
MRALHGFRLGAWKTLAVTSYRPEVTSNSDGCSPAHPFLVVLTATQNRNKFTLQRLFISKPRLNNFNLFSFFSNYTIVFLRCLRCSRVLRCADCPLITIAYTSFQVYTQTSTLHMRIMVLLHDVY